MNKAIFLDRDGTVVINKHYLSDPDDIELMPGVGEGLARLSGEGYKLVLVTNQSGIGRGFFTEDAMHQQHAKLAMLLDEFGVKFDAIKYCPHTPADNCPCRKPAPTMILDAARDLSIDCSQSYMIGDKDSDVLAGLRAKCRTIFISNNTDSTADYQVTTFAETVDVVIYTASSTIFG